MQNIYVKLYIEFGLNVPEQMLRNFLSRDLVAVLFGGAKLFVQFRWRA